MTIFVVPLSRALPLSLLKSSFSRGPNPGHKYLKRVPFFVKGKRRYRYYYADDLQRTSGKAHHDPHEEDEHYLIPELQNHHPNLKGKLKPTTEITASALKQELGIQETKVTIGAGFKDKLVNPVIEKEEAGESPTRSALQRTFKAFEMLPDYVKEMVDPETIESFKDQQVPGKHGMYRGLKDFILNTQDEDPYERAWMCAGYANPVDGSLHVLDPSFPDPVGIPAFKSAVTRGEEVVWHEFGHHAHFAMEARPKDHPDRKAIEEWKKGLPGARISDYAYSAWYEDFAESFSCAVSHPKQLAEDCPERYEWMRKHVLTSLPPIGEMLDTPDGELDWWKPKSDTPASKMLRHLQHRRPPPRFHTYYSEKDQFYSVQKDGRLLYLRIGPVSKDEEAGWDRMPDTVYTETIEGADGKPIEVTLPKHERTLGPRFKKTESIKEVYDEHGRALTDKQAYFYLGQDDQKVIVQAGDPTPDKMDDYLKEVDKKKDDTHLLSYKMYTTLGFQLEHAAELARLKKVVGKQKAYDAALKRKKGGKKLTAKEATLVNEYEMIDDPKKPGKKKKGKQIIGVNPRPDFGLSRHEWAPVPVPRDLFVQKTGTFKFGDLREAPEQPWTARDPDTGKVITRYDEATGKQVPVLTARIYEQVNPDGTFTRISVSESVPFSVGQKIWIPTAEGRERIELKRGMSLDPFELAREYHTSAAELLALNQRYDRGQITDPVLAALINPHGKPILDSTTLTQMMRDAALDTHVDKVTAKTVGRRAWVTIRGGTRVNHGIAHIQVEFDGAGPPKVVGDYWARKLGKSEIRIDELLNAKDELDIPRVIETKPKKGKTTPGSLVWFQDPRTGKQRLGTVAERKGGAIIVQPEKGANRKAVSVGRVKATSEDVIPDSPLLRRRIVKPLEHDVLLYMDEVPRDSGTDSPEGTIKIKMPSDGRFDYEELRSMPGVRTIDPKAGKDLELTISAEDLPRFRERMGGFVMDSRVKAKLKQLDDRSRTLAEEHGKKQIIEYEDLEDEDGNVNPDGPLGGLVLGDEGIQPGEHRMRALQKLAKNGGRLYAAHFMGTGKTALAIMASEMMRNLKDPATGKAHPARSTKRTLHIVPLNTAENWHQEYTKFGKPPTLIGSSTLSGASQIPKLPAQRTNEKADAYAKRAIKFWKDGLDSHPGWWNPWEDNRDNVVIAYEYFQQNEQALDLLNQFDGLVVDEAHRVALDNETSRAIERWNPKMKLFLLLSGTPITNTIDTLPRIVDLVTGGKTQLGSRDEFREVYLVASAVLKAMGKRNPPRTDINPQKIGELAAILQPIMDVATTADVKGKSMPAVLLDENEPAHMTGQQARMYRAAMAVLTPDERDALGVSSSLGIDEAALLGDEARRKVSVARSLANCLSYKAPSQRENAVYTAIEYTKDSKGEMQEKAVKKEFTLPTFRQMTLKRPKGWGGRWPTRDDMEKGVVPEGYFAALGIYMDNILGVAYEALAGKPISKKLLTAVKNGKMETKTGEPWGKEGGKLKNPDYGPEGMMCRGVLDETTGQVNSLSTKYYDSESGDWKTVEIPVGMRFIRDPNAKAAGVYYHEDDWDFTGRFKDDGEQSTEPGGSGGDDEGATPKTRKRGQQGPLEGREGYSVQRHPSRRKERAMFDAVTTTGNAKCDKLEQNMRSIFKEETGSGSDSQMIIFGNRIGSSVRTVESKLRTMGYMDINEALGNPEWSTEADKERAQGTRKFFVSYMGASATLGDRDINSEIFRRQQDAFGKDTGISMLVWRTMYGTTKQKYLKPGEMREPWGRSHRRKIAKNFVDGSGRMTKAGLPAGLEVPMRVVGSENDDGSIGQRYIYESDVPGKVRRQVQQLETAARSQRGAAEASTMKKISDALMPYAVDRKPLSDAQIDIFNNTQVMLASDAANVGLNWPCEHLTMYDSLFSPMEEWQRITRAARMLPPAVRGPAKKLIEKVGAYIDTLEAKNDFKEYENVDSAILIVNEALEKGLTPAERMELNDLPGGAPDQIVEAWFAKRAFGKIAALREEVGNKLRSEGAVPDPTKPPGPDNFIPPEAVQGSDIINEIIRKHLTPFDKEVMKSRRYLVDVKRLTTSVDVPEFETMSIIDPSTGKKKKIKVPTGKFVTESPSQAERAQLAQGRAKMVPYEYLLKIIQSAMPTHTKYDYVDSYRGSMGAFSRMPDDDEPSPGPEPAKPDPQPTTGKNAPGVGGGGGKVKPKTGKEGWSHFGTQVDALSLEQQRSLWTATKSGEPFEAWLAGLYRGPKKKLKQDANLKEEAPSAEANLKNAELNLRRIIQDISYGSDDYSEGDLQDARATVTSLKREVARSVKKSIRFHIPLGGR